eukprot:6100330-Pyramimonas_sp.AAC.1
MGGGRRERALCAQGVQAQRAGGLARALRGPGHLPIPSQCPHRLGVLPREDGTQSPSTRARECSKHRFAGPRTQPRPRAGRRPRAPACPGGPRHSSD